MTSVSLLRLMSCHVSNYYGFTLLVGYLFYHKTLKQRWPSVGSSRWRTDRTAASLTNSPYPLSFVAHNVAVLMRDSSLLLASRSKQGTLTYTADGEWEI